MPRGRFADGQHSQGDRDVYASGTHFIPEQLFGLFERTSLSSRVRNGQPSRLRTPARWKLQGMHEQMQGISQRSFQGLCHLTV